jgi:superfamily II DNA or RNA helicase
MYYNKKEMGNIKVIIFSLKTLQIYLKKWMSPYKDFDYNLEPDELTQFINLGYMINDETHQDYHNVFTTQLFFNTNMFIGITATLENNDRKMMALYNVLFPLEERANIEIPINRYITAISVKYYFSDMKRLRYKGPFGYNHNILEATIIKNKKILNNYLEMIMRIALGGYIKDRVEGDKLLIFASKVEMCILLIKYFKDSDYFKDIKITKYTEEDDYTVIAENDIIISTLGSSSTALDIPNLIAVIQTVAVDSIQSNKQSIGRLRDLPDKVVKFYYIWSGNIKQHSGYNFRRTKYFASIAKTFMNKVFQKSI